MDNYLLSTYLLGMRDQNLPLFKETRVKHLQSIDKIYKLITIAPRLTPKVPNYLLSLDPNDPEWDDKMIYPIVNHWKHIYRSFLFGLTTLFYGYNWNVLHANPRLKLARYFLPVLSAYYLGVIVHGYNDEKEKVRLFENYCEVRAKELVESRKYLLKHDHFKRFVYFHNDLTQTLDKVHRQANNHHTSDFKDSELVMQDFIRRHSDSNNPEEAMFTEDGIHKMLN